MLEGFEVALGKRIRAILGVLALLPAASWFLLVVLRWFGITERFAVLNSTLEGTGSSLVRGVILFVVLPLVSAILGIAIIRIDRQRTKGATIVVIGFVLAALNVLSRKTGL